MKLRYLSPLLLFILFVHHSNEQRINLSPVLDNMGIGPSFGGSNNENSGGLSNVIRTTTNRLLKRLEGPRDRIVQFIRPAVQSEFSRNVTNALYLIWNRVQGSNSTIMSNQLFRNSIVIPINTTIERLKAITSPENSTNLNFNVIDLNRPEDEAHLREYMGSAATNPGNNPSVIFLVRDEESNETDSQPITSTTNEESSQIQFVQKSEKSDVTTNDIKNFTQSSNPVENLTMFKRDTHASDNNDYHITPETSKKLFDIINNRSQTMCMVNTACHAASRSHLYKKESPISLFNKVLEVSRNFKNFTHTDYNYYLEAYDYGLLNYDADSYKSARECDIKFPHCNNNTANLLKDYLKESSIY